MAAHTARFAPAGLAVAGLALAVAIAAGIVAVPDLAGSVSDATESMGGWLYLAVVVLVFLETSALVGFVIHGELVLLVAGVAAEHGDAALPVAIALAWGAAVAGDVVSLLLGRRLGRGFLERHGPKVRLGEPQLTRIDAFFARHGRKAVLLGRWTGFLRATLPFVAGSSGMPLRRLLPASAISALLWTVTFIAIGFVFSESFRSAGEIATRWALVLILVTGAGLVVRSRLAHRRSARSDG